MLVKVTTLEGTFKPLRESMALKLDDIFTKFSKIIQHVHFEGAGAGPHDVYKPKGNNQTFLGFAAVTADGGGGSGDI